MHIPQLACGGLKKTMGVDHLIYTLFETGSLAGHCCACQESTGESPVSISHLVAEAVD